MNTFSRRSFALIVLPAGIAITLLLAFFVLIPSDVSAAGLAVNTLNMETEDLVGFITETKTVGPAVLINEIRIDQPSTDNDEYFELSGPPGTPLTGTTYLVIGDGTGGSGVIEAVVDLDDQFIPVDGYFLAVESTFSLPGTADLTTTLNFENSDNVTHLLVRNFSGSYGDDLDTNDDGSLDVTPWDEVLDLIALIVEENPPTGTEYHYGPPQVGPDGSYVPGHAYRCPEEWLIGAFDPTSGDGTPGEANQCPVLINEIRIDQPSSDYDEYFELYGVPGIDLTGTTYLVIGDGSSTLGSGVIEAVVNLNNYAIPDDGYFLAAKDADTMGELANLVTSTLNFENSDNVTHLLVRNFSGSNGDDLDTDDDGTLDVTPWDEIVDLIALVESDNPPSGTEYHYGPPQIGPDGGNVPGHVYRCPEGWLIGEFDPDDGVDTPGSMNPCHVIINEVRIDQDGSDNDEYFELFGAPGSPLTGTIYLVIGDGTGGSGVIEAVVDLDDQFIPADGYFLAVESSFSLPGTADLTTTLNFENSDNVTHLLVRNFSGSNGDDLDTNDDGILDVTPWDEILDLIAIIEEDNPPSGTERHYGPPQIGPNGSSVPFHTYHCPAGWQIGNDDPADGGDTPGAVNDCPLAISNLYIEKIGPAYAAIGHEVVYTITLTNNEVPLATSVRVTDSLPISTTYDSDNSGISPSNPEPGVYAWNFGDITAPDVTVFNLTVTVDSNVLPGTILTNTVEITTTTADVNGDRDEVLSEARPPTDLKISKTGPEAVLVSELVSYTIELANEGFQDAIGVSFTDTLTTPLSIDHWVISPTNTTVNSNEITWSGDVTASETIVFEFVASHTGGIGDVISNTAEFSHTSGSGSATTAFKVVGQPTNGQLLLSEFVDSPTTAEFVEIHNASTEPLSLEDVYLTDATYAGGGIYYYKIVTGADYGGGNNYDFHARFPEGAYIDPGEYQTIALNGSTNFAAEFGVDPTYELYEDGGSADAIPDMREVVTGSIYEGAGLTNGDEIVILYYWDGATDLVTDLDYVPYGGSDETVDKSGVSIDGPDAGTETSTYLNDTPLSSQANADSPGSGYSAMRGDINEGDEIKSGGNGAAGHDETSENLDETWCTGDPTPNQPNSCPADLFIEKQAINTKILPGELISYTITYVNNGAGEAADVSITDTLPTDTTYVDHDSQGLPCTGCTLDSTGPLVWTVGPLALNAGGTITLTLQISDTVDYGTVLTNTVEIGTTSEDGDWDDNRYDCEDQVTWLRDVTVVKEGPEIGIPGDTLVYSLTVSNPALMTAEDVVLSDTLPDEATYLDDNSGLAHTNPSPGVYVWELSDIDPGVDISFNLTVTVSGAIGTETVLTNQAEVSTPSEGDDPNNNTAQHQTTVYPFVSIYDIQTVPNPAGNDASPYEGQVVWVEGIVTAEPGELGYDTDYFVIEDPAGGPWSGLIVYRGDEFNSIDAPEGAHVRLLGVVDEIYNLTELDIQEYGYPSSMEVLSLGNPVPAVETIPTGDYISPGTAEQWESVLIQFRYAAVTKPDLGYGEWAFNDGSGETQADDYGGIDGNMTYLPQLGDFYDFIRGIGWYSYDFYKIQPRYDADIQLLRFSKTTEPNVLPGELLTYTISFFNHTEKDLTDVTITDLVPTTNAEYAYVLDGGSYASGEVTWVTNVSAYTGLEVRFVVSATGSTGSIISNTLYTVSASNWPTSTLGPPVMTMIGEYTPIPYIQGDGHRSPLVGQLVKTRGQVIGFFEGNTSSGDWFDGFYIQDETGDGDPNTSDGIFINHDDLNIDVDIGDLVEVTGQVQEFGEYDNLNCPVMECLTQIGVSEVADVTVLGSARAAIIATELDPPGDPGAAQTYFESLEGMLVTLPMTGAVTGPTSYGAVVVIPGDEGVFRALRGSPQEGMTFGVRYADRYGGNADNLIVGSVIDNIDGPLAYTYGDYNVITQDGDDWVTVYSQPEPDPIPSWPAPGPDEFTVATFNTYNFDGTDDPEKMNKVVASVQQMNGPAFIALQEIRVSAVMTDLLTNLAGVGYPYDYAYSFNDIRGYGVAVLWRTDQVKNVTWSGDNQACSPNGNPAAAAWDHTCDSIPDEYPLFSRRPVVVNGTVQMTGGDFDVTVIGNHFKSKLDGAASDVRRLEQAEFVNGLVKDLVAGGQTHVIVTGDLNDFEDSAPLEALYADDTLLNTWYTLPPEARYSYIYQGVSQILDHILITPIMLNWLEDVGPVHINADFPYEPYYDDDSTVFHTTDHDLLVATFAIDYLPVAEDDDLVFTEDDPETNVTALLLSNDYDADEPIHIYGLDNSTTVGLARLENRRAYYDPNGQFEWLAAGETAGDSFSYHISDGDDGTATADANITIQGVNDPPVAADDSGGGFETDEDTAFTSGDVLANDSDIDTSDVLSVESFNTSATAGLVTYNGDGTFDYDPAGQFDGLLPGETAQDSFTYVLSDGIISDTATVTINITGINDAPLVDAGPDQTVDEGDLVQFNGTFNDPGRNAELGSPNADATLSWDFGDGKTAKGTLTPDHAYADDGVYTVTLTVTDQYSEIGQDILLVTVENVAPALADIPDMETMVHESVSLAISFTDPGVLDTHTVLIEWGDETSTTRNLGAKVSELTSNHTYRIPGIYTVTVTVTDKDGEEDTATLQITVNAYQAYLPFIGRP